VFNKGNFEKLGEDIYVYHNFVTDQECDSLIELATSLPEDKWIGRFNTEGEGHKWSDISVDQLIPIHERIKSLLHDGIHLGTNLSIIRMEKGATWGLHSDNHDFLEIRKKSKSLIEGQEFDLAPNNIVGLVLYFNNFEGGCLYYPEQNIEYQPKKGDLVMHSSEEHCLHGVNELKSNVRYSHSNNLFNLIKIPKGQ
jgi:hypothetical protein